jgi:large subunit ribosomal protein L31
MKANLHPTYYQTTVSCACGNKFIVGSTSQTLSVDICSKCHPFFTGEQKFLDVLGRVDKFVAKRQAASSYTKKGKKGQDDAKTSTPKSLKEMLTVTKTK